MLKSTVILLALATGGLAKSCAFFWTAAADKVSIASQDARKHCRDDIDGEPEGDQNFSKDTNRKGFKEYCNICRLAREGTRDYNTQLYGAGPAAVRCGYYTVGTCGDFDGSTNQ
ncbi:uncharacterized protein RAG0_17034 [Rhynchosporium agropyri]|uniref:Uncharacterized protein n=1 Tax=Rhynchosporium agropyri TaxID=914238 RepID=A0A1E1LSR5_9HELO|nr:uncharacterized protein RAG0_17034 [Rhynchosporium agropyri]